MRIGRLVRDKEVGVRSFHAKYWGNGKRVNGMPDGLRYGWNSIGVSKSPSRLMST